MSLTTKTYWPLPGSYTISDGSIAYVKLLKVKREGTSYDIIRAGTPTNRQVLYTASSGSLTFSVAFNGDSSGATDVTEKVYVLYDN